MKPGSKRPDLSSMRNIATVGSRPLAARPLLALMMAATLAVSAGAIATASPAPAPVEQSATAQVVAKVWNSDGALLSKGYYRMGDNNVWQPVSDAVGSSRQLVLSLPGEVRPVVVAVSPEIFERYCSHVSGSDYMASPVAKDATRQAACGSTYEMGKPAPAAIALDQIQVSFIKDARDGSIELTRLDGNPKMAQSFTERYKLWKAHKGQLDRSQQQAAHRAPSL